MQLVLCAGAAVDRSVLSAVTPDTLGMGEAVKLRWNYEDGNGGMYFILHWSCCCLVRRSIQTSNLSEEKRKVEATRGAVIL